MPFRGQAPKQLPSTPSPGYVGPDSRAPNSRGRAPQFCRWDSPSSVFRLDPPVRISAFHAIPGPIPNRAEVLKWPAFTFSRLDRRGWESLGICRVCRVRPARIWGLQFVPRALLWGAVMGYCQLTHDRAEA